MKKWKQKSLALFLASIMLFETMTVNAVEINRDYPDMPESFETTEETNETEVSEETQETSNETLQTDESTATGESQESHGTDESITPDETQESISEETQESMDESETELPALDDELIVIDDPVQSLSLDDYKTASVIIGEDVSRRESNIKYFLNEDFSYTAAIYPKAVHYQEDGQWKDIDNGLVSATIDGLNTYVQNKSNRMKVSFAQDTQQEKLINITIDGYKLSWGMDTQNRSSVRKLVANTPDLYTKAAANDAPEVSQQIDDVSITEENTDSPEASLITENPEAAKLFAENNFEALKELEEASKRTDFPAFALADAGIPEKGMGIPAEEQQSYKTSNAPDEETLDTDYHDTVLKSNAEKTTLTALE